MLSLEWPWALLALALPLLVRLLPPAEPGRQTALRVPFLSSLQAPAASEGLQSRSAARWLAALLAWVLLCLAAARPVWLGELSELPRTGRDLMLAVDLSRSMDETDFVLQSQLTDRLSATKHVAGRFIRSREGDRLGLILFGEQAYLQAPLTFDRRTVISLLNESVIGLAGEATAIGDAIGLAVKRLRESDAEDKVLILMTDGASNAGAIEPVRAAELAAAEGLTIYTVGIGSDPATLRQMLGFVRMDPAAALDEATLQQVAEMTGGRYFRARDTAEFQQIYRLIDQIEPVAREGESFRPRVQLFVWPLGAALLLALGLAGPALRASTAAGRPGGDGARA